MSQRLRIFFTLFAFGLATVSASGAEAGRHAFVVGNDRYVNLAASAQLERAANDARSIARALSALSFNVTVSINVTRSEFNSGWQGFLERLQEGDTAVFFFAGHGVEVEGQNFFLPADVPTIQTGRQELLKRESLSLNELLQDLRGRKAAVSLFILDACRDNPFALAGQRSVGSVRGLASISSPPDGTFIMYSAAAGETALDRLPEADQNPNSVYTRALLEKISTPGLGLPEMARRIREQVNDLAALAGHRQRPAYYDGVTGHFCLAGCNALTMSAPSLGLAIAEPVRLEIDIPLSVQRRIDFAGGGIAAKRALELQKIRSASYRLNPIDVERVSSLDSDLFLTEGMTAISALTGKPVSKRDVAQLARKQDGTRRLVLSEFSLAQIDVRRSDYFAADYLTDDAPDWLLKSDSNEPGRYDAMYCNRGWQATLVGDENGRSIYNVIEHAPLGRLIELGFHGVLLIDVAVHARLMKECPGGVHSMAQLVERVAAVARKLDPNFLVLIEHDNALVSLPEVSGVIDGVIRRFGSER